MNKNIYKLNRDNLLNNIKDNSNFICWKGSSKNWRSNLSIYSK